MKLLSPGQAARQYNTTTAVLARWRRRGTGPAYYHLTPRVIRYATDDLAKWFTDAQKPCTANGKPSAIAGEPARA